MTTRYTPFAAVSRAAAVAHRRARERLQFERHVLEDMPHPRTGTKPLKEAAALADRAAMLDQRRQPGHEPVIEAGQRVRRKILQPAEVHRDLENRKRCPLVRAAQNLELL